MSEYDIKHKENSYNGVFYIRDSKGVLSELTYKKRGDNILVIDHTETRDVREGEGLASEVLAKAVDFARENNYKIDPLCPFVEVKFDETPEYQKLRAYL